MNKSLSFLIIISFLVHHRLCAQTNVIDISSKNETTLPFLEDSVSASTQIIVVYSNPNKITIGKLFGLELINNQWKNTFDTIDCSLGRKGFAEKGDKVEGDGKTPSGQFPLDFAFGYKDDLKAPMKFVELHDKHYWVSDSKSTLYNRLVTHNPRDQYSEKMKRNDHLYKYGIVIGYNTKKIVKGKGSAIFIHVERRKGSPTAGCIAVSEEKMKALIGWVKPEKNATIIMGTKKDLASYLQYQ